MVFMANKVKKQPVSGDDSSKSEIYRRFKANPFVFIGTIVVLVIVVVAFVFVPAMPGVNGGGAQGDLNFGAYDKVPINYVPGNYFSRARENIEYSYRSSINESNAQFMSYQIWREAFEETVVHTAVLQEMKKTGYTAPKDLVDREVAQQPQFMDENGRFSSIKYRQYDNSTRMAIWRQVQESIAERHYHQDIGELRRPSGEEAFVADMAARQRRFEGAAFSIGAYPDQEIITYAAENPALFKTAHLSRITISSSEREAKQVLASVKDGTSTFEDAARTQSQDTYAERGGDMGIKMAFELSSEGLDADQQAQLAGLPRGEYSDIIKLSDGWAFFRAEDAAYPADIADAAVLAKIRGYVMDFERGRVEDFFFNEAADLVNIAAEFEQSQTPEWETNENGSRVRIGRTGFDEAVYRKGLEKFSFGPLPVNYGDTKVSTQYGEVEIFPLLSSFQVAELAYAASDENFWLTAFSTPLYTLSKPLVLGNSVVILYPVEESAAEEANIEDAKSRYSFALNYSAEQSVHSFFLRSEKLEDRFMDTFLRYFWN
ncbi:hypothetical protein FACS1894163_00760 [Spirochaetia bacterium]|nr:hypothetical protein FACS1894163_00760 [Spirochaetia bacterium]